MRSSSTGALSERGYNLQGRWYVHAFAAPLRFASRCSAVGEGPRGCWRALLPAARRAPIEVGRFMRLVLDWPSGTELRPRQVGQFT